MLYFNHGRTKPLTEKGNEHDGSIVQDEKESEREHWQTFTLH
jgi:hypothetical protein